MNDQLPRCPRALLFDMDGTLTQPMLDFPKIKVDMGIGTQPILEALDAMTESDRRTAEAILHQHEERAARESILNSGCDALIAWVRQNNLKTALIMRNSRKSVAVVLAKHGLDFKVLITREDGKFKPDPQPLRLACERLQVDRTDAWMIGDGSYDCAAGNAAGIKTVWISHGRPREFPDQPWKTVSDLVELLDLLKRCG